MQLFQPIENGVYLNERQEYILRAFEKQWLFTR